LLVLPFKHGIVLVYRASACVLFGHLAGLLPINFNKTN
jgi:hypothetical protein